MSLMVSQDRLKDEMMLDLNTLRQLCSDGESFEYTFFWGHQPAKDGRITKTCFSQWYATAEHWMMAEKARLFGDAEVLAQILKTGDPREAKALGRKVSDFNDSVWNKNARSLVTEGNVAKFSQNEDLRNFLISTGDSVLVEASPYDRIWGIGLKSDDERAQHPKSWQGQNLLGFALMDVREQLNSL
jgi:ribA/ribD-fused uncharacterized protein